MGRKCENTFQPGTVAYRLLDDPEHWSGMGVVAIAREIGCSRQSVHIAFQTILDRTGECPVNRKKTKIQRLRDEDWSQKTLSDIAKELDSTPAAVLQYVYRLSKRGHYVQFLDR